MEPAAKAVSQLQTMADHSRSAVIQLACHVATGIVLVEQGQYADAIPHLQEDASGPEAMFWLWKAYTRSGAQEDAKRLAARLASLNEPTIEQALVVPQFRSALAEASQQAAK